jgi:hypothetical protein
LAWLGLASRVIHSSFKTLSSKSKTELQPASERSSSKQEKLTSAGTREAAVAKGVILSVTKGVILSVTRSNIVGGATEGVIRRTTQLCTTSGLVFACLSTDRTTVEPLKSHSTFLT